MAQINNLRDFLAEARRRERLHEFAQVINQWRKPLKREK